MPTPFAPVELTNALTLATVKSAAILTVAMLTAQLLRRRSATLRHAVWTAALASVIAVLVLPAVMPPWSGVRILPNALTIAPKAVSIHERSIARGTALAEAVAPVVAPVGAMGSASLPWATIIMWAWLAGAAVIVARSVAGRAGLARLARGAPENARASGLTQRLASAMGISRSVRVLISERTDIPLTWGIVRPTIALPAEAAEWTDECRHHVLQHELAHVSRHDALTQIVAEVACAAFWFNPLAWHAAREMRRERERACDDYVITHGAVASHYAGDLLALVAGADPRAHGAAFAFGRPSQIEGRLSALLDATLDRSALGARHIAGVVGAAVLLAAPAAVLSTADARPAPMVVHEAPPPAVPMAAVAVLTPPVVKSAPRAARPAQDTIVKVLSRPSAMQEDVFASCGAGMSSHMHSDAESSANAATWTASGDINGCTFNLKSAGIVTIDSSATGFQRLGPNATFEATANIHGVVTRLAVYATEVGVPSYEFTRNGQAADFANGGRAWLAQFLLGLERTTAFALDQRLPLLLKAGVPSVLDEIDHMHSDYARVAYATRLIARAPLDADAVHRVSAIGLSAAPDHQAGDVAEGLAAKYTLSADDVRATIDRVAQMSADYEKFRTLDNIARSQRMSDDLRNAYLAAANTIRDQRVRDRATASLVRR